MRGKSRKYCLKNVKEGEFETKKQKIHSSIDSWAAAENKTDL